MAKIAEEMKALPSRVAERLAEGSDGFRRRKLRRFHPMMFEEILHMAGEPGDPVAILMAASLIREDAPWLYELAMEVYRAVKAGDREGIQREMHRLRHFSEFGMRGPWMEEFGFGSREQHMLFMEFPRMLEHMLSRTFIERDPPPPAKRLRKPSSSKDAE